MKQQLSLVTLLVDDYDRAIAWYTNKLGFDVRQDKHLSDGRRWVVVQPPGSSTGIVLSLARNAEQKDRVGNQAGGRISFFLQTDNFARDHAAMYARGVQFLETPRRESTGVVAAFADLYGNTWNLLGAR